MHRRRYRSPILVAAPAGAEEARPRRLQTATLHGTVYFGEIVRCKHVVIQQWDIHARAAVTLNLNCLV